MKKNRTDSELSGILQEDIEIPEKVQQRIEGTCRELEQRDNGDKIIHMAKRKRIKIGVAVVALCGTISMGVMAASGIFSWNKVEDDTTTKYEFKMDKDAVAHDLVVSMTYTPEGYMENTFGNELQEEVSEEEYVANILETEPDNDEAELREEYQRYQEQQRVEESLQPNSQYIYVEKRDADGGYVNGYEISIYNATKLYNAINIWNGDLFEYKNVSGEEETKIQGLDTRIFTWKDGVQNESILMFNPMEGYMIEITWNLENRETLPLEEMKKVAEGLDIQMLDTELTYVSAEEGEKLKETLESRRTAYQDYQNEKREAGIDVSQVKKIGETISVGNIYSTEENAEITVTDVQVCDSLSMVEYNSSHFNLYKDRVAPVVNEDGTIKPHGRTVIDVSTGDRTEETDVNSKFVVVKVHEKNNAQEDTAVSAPILMPMKTENGDYAYLDKDYEMLGTDFLLEWQVGMVSMGNECIYSSEETNYQEVKGETIFGEHTLAPGEERDITLVYVMDDDLLANMVLTYAINMDGKFIDISQR